jgi:hypothetical protein
MSLSFFQPSEIHRLFPGGLSTFLNIFTSLFLFGVACIIPYNPCFASVRGMDLLDYGAGCLSYVSWSQRRCSLHFMGLAHSACGSGFRR